MTSVLRRYAQIEPRTQFFYVLGEISGYINTSTSIPTSSLMSLQDVNSAFLGQVQFPPSVIYPFTLLKDLGRQITVFDPTIVGSPHVALFRQVMIVNGINVEGIPTQSTPFVYICTWIDATPGGHIPFNVADVARTG
jgi:hypothetical protein